MRDARLGAVRWAAGAVSALAALAGCGTQSAAHTLYVENDAFGASNRDRDYTNGVRLSGVYATQEAPTLLRRAAEAVPVLENTTTEVGWVVGQDIYTPADLTLDPPDPNDRPYAGWLYAGLLFAKARRGDDGPAGDRVDVLELDVGVVGPSSQADRVQTQFHDLVDAQRGAGWDHQLENEPGLVLSYEHRRRLLAGEGWLGNDWDLIGVAGVTVGNVFDHAAAGATARWGRLLPRDFGPNTIHSTAVDVPDDGPEPHDGFRWYVFAGAEGRAVARNLFLDGNTFERSPDVDSKPLVGEVRAGFAIEWGAFRFAYTHIGRSREFDGQEHPQAYGSFALTWTSKF